VSKSHAVLGGVHLSGLDAERIDRVVEALRGFEVDYLVPQHCTGAEALVRLAQRMGPELVVSSTGSTLTVGG
jgi:7,8-dihydropterin-6-yl-methyl-4-(beta-D-ribofuranosyl)aminobenzene 5'-phosphate synthase